MLFALAHTDVVCHRRYHHHHDTVRTLTWCVYVLRAPQSVDSPLYSALSTLFVEGERYTLEVHSSSANRAREYISQPVWLSPYLSHLLCHRKCFPVSFLLVFISSALPNTKKQYSCILQTKRTFNKEKGTQRTDTWEDITILSNRLGLVDRLRTLSNLGKHLLVKLATLSASFERKFMWIKQLVR